MISPPNRHPSDSHHKVRSSAIAGERYQRPPLGEVQSGSRGPDLTHQAWGPADEDGTFGPGLGSRHQGVADVIGGKWGRRTPGRLVGELRRRTRE